MDYANALLSLYEKIEKYCLGNNQFIMLVPYIEILIIDNIKMMLLIRAAPKLNVWEGGFGKEGTFWHTF